VCLTETIPADIAAKEGFDLIARKLIANGGSIALPDAAMTHQLMQVKPGYYWQMRLGSDIDCLCSCRVYIEGKLVFVRHCLNKRKMPAEFHDGNDRTIHFIFKDLELDEQNNEVASQELRNKLMEQGLGTIRVAIHKKIKSRSVKVKQPKRKRKSKKKTKESLVQPNNSEIQQKYESINSTPLGVNKTLQVGMTCTIQDPEPIFEQEEDDDDEDSGNEKALKEPQYSYIIDFQNESYQEFYFYYRSELAMNAEKRILKLLPKQIGENNPIQIGDEVHSTTTQSVQDSSSTEAHSDAILSTPSKVGTQSSGTADNAETTRDEENDKRSPSSERDSALQEPDPKRQKTVDTTPVIVAALELEPLAQEEEQNQMAEEAPVLSNSEAGDQNNINMDATKSETLHSADTTTVNSMPIANEPIVNNSLPELEHNTTVESASSDSTINTGEQSSAVDSNNLTPKCSNKKCERLAEVHCRQCYDSRCKIHMDSKHESDGVEEEHASAVIPIQEFLRASLKKKMLKRSKQDIAHDNLVNKQQPIEIDDL